MLQWMQNFTLPPVGEFDETAVRWEAGEAQFGGKEKTPTRVTVIPADRATDFVAGCLRAPPFMHWACLQRDATHAACDWGTCLELIAFCTVAKAHRRRSML